MPKLKLADAAAEYSDRILIVDDDEIDFDLTQKSFNDAFFENDVLWLESGEELFNYLERKGRFTELGNPNPILILLDLNMPRVSGQEVLERLKAEGKLDHLRIVLLTNASADYIEESQLNQFPYIQKPLSFEEFLDFVMSEPLFVFE